MSIRIKDNSSPLSGILRQPSLALPIPSPVPPPSISSSSSSSPPPPPFGRISTSPSSPPKNKRILQSTPPGGGSPTTKEQAGKLAENYAAFQRRSRRHEDLLRRQRSVDGRRSHQSRLPLPSRSYSLKSRLSSSTGHLAERRKPCSAELTRTGPVNGNDNTVYFVNESQMMMGPMNNNIDDKCHHQSSAEAGGNDVGKQRQMSGAVNSMPLRQSSVRSYGSGKSVISSSLSRGNSTKGDGSGGRGGGGGAGSPYRISHLALSTSTTTDNNNEGGTTKFPWKDLPSKERRHRKVACAVGIFSSFLLISAVVCTLVSLHRSPHIDEQVRKENEHLLKVIQQTASSLNTTTSSSTTSTSLQSDANDGVNNNFSLAGSNSGSSSSSSSNNRDSQNGQSLPRTTDVNLEDDYSPYDGSLRSDNKSLRLESEDPDQ